MPAAKLNKVLWPLLLLGLVLGCQSAPSTPTKEPVPSSPTTSSATVAHTSPSVPASKAVASTSASTSPSAQKNSNNLGTTHRNSRNIPHNPRVKHHLASKGEPRSKIKAPRLRRIVVTPAKVTLKPGERQFFAAQGFDQNNRPLKLKVTWQATSGRIRADGLYTACEGEGLISITASVAGSPVKGLAIVEVRGASPKPQPALTTLELYPATITLRAGQEQLFVVKNWWGAVQDLQWQACGGQINAQGVFRAGPTPGVYTVHVRTPNGAVGQARVTIKSKPRRLSKLRLALLPWIGYGPFFIAREKGFFEQEGVSIDLVMIADTYKRRQALIKGRVDAIVSTTDAFAVGAAQAVNPQLQPYSRLPGKVVLKLDDSCGGDGIVVRQGIDTLYDLQGKKIAFTESMPSHFFLLYLLATAGLEYSDVQPLPKHSVEEAAAALRQGEADAAVVWEPHVSSLAKLPDYHVLITSKDARGLISDILVVSNSTLKNKRRAVLGLVRAWIFAVEYYKSHPAQATAIMAQGLGFSLPDTKEMLAGIEFADLAANQKFCGTAQEQGPFFALFAKAGQLWVNTQVIQKAADPATHSDWSFVRQPSPAPMPFRIAYVQWAGYAPLFLAKHLGYFSAIIDGVQLIRIEDTAKRRQLLKQGRLEASISTIDAFAIECSPPLNIKAQAVLKLDDSAGGDGMVVRSDIQSMADLEGQKVAFVKGMPSQFFLMYLASQAGLAPQDLTLMPAGSAAEAAQLFVKGQVAAAVTWEPFLSNAARDGHGKILITTKDARGLIVDILIVSQEALAERSQDVQVIVKGWLKAVDYWEKLAPDSPQRHQAEQVMAQGLGLTVAEFREMLPGIVYGNRQENRLFFGHDQSLGARTFQEVFTQAAQIWQTLGIVSQTPAATQVACPRFIGK